MRWPKDKSLQLLGKWKEEGSALSLTFASWGGVEFLGVGKVVEATEHNLVVRITENSAFFLSLDNCSFEYSDDVAVESTGRCSLTVDLPPQPQPASSFKIIELAVSTNAQAN